MTLLPHHLRLLLFQRMVGRAHGRMDVWLLRVRVRVSAGDQVDYELMRSISKVWY